MYSSSTAVAGSLRCFLAVATAVLVGGTHYSSSTAVEHACTSMRTHIYIYIYSSISVELRISSSAGLLLSSCRAASHPQLLLRVA
jgi:hypothetical protein